ncbi:MAG TPA: hypothetical protein P5548_03870 [Candidatus Moranbacteria bacterium]|nr:hypothetical protein [Candidatus Moranbacteria bacterium]
MTKNEKVCKKEGQHIWDTSYQCDDEINGNFDELELELRCLRCGATAFLNGYWDEAPKNWVSEVAK